MFFTQDDKDSLALTQRTVMDLVRVQGSLGQRLANLENESEEVKKTLAGLVRTLNNHADMGNDISEAVNDIVALVNKHSEAIELLAKGMGKDIAVKPEVPATITLTSGEPEKLVLVKARKTIERKPEPTTIVVPRELMEGK